MFVLCLHRVPLDSPVLSPPRNTSEGYAKLYLDRNECVNVCLWCLAMD